MFSTRGSSVLLRLLPALLLAAGLAITTAPASATPLPAVTYTVNTTADNPAATCGGGPCSLRGAVNAANAVTPYSIVTINVPAGHYPITAAGGGQLQLLKNEIHLLGTGGLAVLDATGCGCRVLDNETSAVIDNLKFTGGVFTATNANGGAGGGVLDNGTLSLANSVVTGNQVIGACQSQYYYYTSTPSYYSYSPNYGGTCGSTGGGGLAKTSTTPIEISNTTISDNVLDVSCTGPPATAQPPYASVSPGNCQNPGGGGLLNREGTATLASDTVTGNVSCVGAAAPPTGGVCQGGSGGGIDNTRFMTFSGGSIVCNVGGYLTGTAPDAGGHCTMPPFFIQPPGANNYDGGNHTYNTESLGGGIASECTANGSSACSLTMTGTPVSDNAVAAQGGGIFNNAAMTLTTVQILGNHAGDPAQAASQRRNGGDGGGIVNLNQMSLVGGTISGNVSGYDGGGLENDYASTIKSTTFSNNIAGSTGGGIETYSDTFLTNVTVTHNCAGDSGTGSLATCGTGSGVAGTGGGIDEYGDTDTITGGSIDHNTAADLGGQNSCSLGGGIRVTDDLIADGTRIESNNACDGGGIFLQGCRYGCYSTLKDQTLMLLNVARQDGGAIYEDSSNPSLTIDHSIVSLNTAGYQTGGLYNTTLGDFTVVNGAIVAGNIVKQLPGGPTPASPKCPNTFMPCA